MTEGNTETKAEVKTETKAEVRPAPRFEPRTDSRPADGRPPFRPRRTKWEGQKYVPRRKVCSFCANKSKEISYKDTAKLRQFVSDRAKIDPRRKTGTCAKHQRLLTVAIKRARHLALLPFVPAHIHKTGGVGVRD